MSRLTAIARPSALALLVALAPGVSLSAAEIAAPVAATPVAVSTKCPVVWRSTFGGNSGRPDTFSITESATGRAYWLSVGEKAAGDIAVTGYDKAHEILSLRVRGKDYRVRLATAVYENEPEPSIKPRFAKDSQVKIKGLDQLSRLTPARRRIVMRWLADAVAAFDAEFKSDSEEYGEQYGEQYAKRLAERAAGDGDADTAGRMDDPADSELNLSVEVLDGPGTTASVVLGTYTEPGDGTTVRFKTLNFPGAAEAPAAPAELLANEGAAYERLSALSLNGLGVPLRDADGRVREGLLGPKAENFTRLTLTNQGVRVWFESGQIDPSSNTPGFVDIPAFELADVLSEDTLRLWKNKYLAK